MAVDRNRLQHDSKSPLGWTLSVACLYLVLSTASGSLANGERLRHHHMKNQLEKTAVLEASSKMPLLGCPNCLFKHDRDREKLESDKLRLEAIKRQILQKLGLRAKPNVTHSLPKEVVMATLSRAEDGDFTGAFGENPDFPTTSEKSGNLDTVEADDFYGRTSEIISFAEQG
ncbi:hypothetical protein HUJ05_011260 [Dendroctonus ponderosae]|nr:hypothetical protein HUJ05_011260 [Dendroctonus ponderosae]